MGNKLLFLVGVLTLSGVAYADEYAIPPQIVTISPAGLMNRTLSTDGSFIIGIYPPQTTKQAPLTTSFLTAVLMRLDAIEARLDTIAKFQKDVVAPMHKEMLEKLKELHP